MATSVYVNNVSTQTPGSYTTIDAQGLLQVGLGASGVVAIIGTAQGGAPYTAAAGDASALPRFTNPQQVQNAFDGGDLLEGCNMLFDPSSDPNLTAGAQQVVALKVNQASQAQAAVPAASGTALTLVAKAWGVPGDSLRVSVYPSTAVSGGVTVLLVNTATGAKETGDFASTAAVVSWVNAQSQLATANAAPGAALPSSTAGVSFSGGAEQAATFADYQACLNLLKQIQVNSVVALTSDPAVTAAMDAHCAYMCGRGQSERDCFGGIQGSSGALPTLAQVKAATLAVNSRHTRLCAQSIARFDSKGTLTVFPPHFLACCAAGMQAGAPLGTPLTFKYLKAQAVYQDASWNPVDNSDDLIAAGCLIARRVDGRGIRWVRNVTTYQQDQNLAFVEGSVNLAVNYVAYNLRNGLNFAVGRPGFAGTQNAVKSVSKGFLDQLITVGAITGYGSLTVTPQADAYLVSVQVVPTLPVNFVLTTIHLELSINASAQAA